MSRPLSPFSILAPGLLVGRLPWGLLFAGLVLFQITGCSHSNPDPDANEPPTAELTAGPVEGGTSHYGIRVFWTGADPDGYIVRYEYAVDPPAAFTETEIADPTNSPGVQTRVIAGPGENLDTLRVSKTADGVVHRFDWVQTLAFNRRFAFSATEWDTLDESMVMPSPGAGFYGMHAIYVRSVDDEGAASVPDRVAFTAETVAPESQITRPIIEAQFLSVGPRITIEWDGDDPDGGGAKPVGYYYRLLDLRSLEPPVSIIQAQPSLLLREDGVDSLWRYQDADTLSHTFFPNVPGNYIFGIRAVDEAGAVEPFLEFGRNVFKLQTLASAGHPIVTLTEPTLGEFMFKGTASPQEVEVPFGVSLSFQVSCSAEEYGGRCESLRWGLNIPDLESDEGWSDWGPIGPLPPFIPSDHPGIVFLYVQVIDDQESATTAAILLNMVDFPLDREVLFVDDARDQTFPRDAEHDAFWESLFDESERFGSEATDRYETFGPNDTFSRAPIPPTLGELGRYRLVIWETVGSGYNGDSGLWQVTTHSRHLGAYLRAGGKTWIGGTLTLAAMGPSVGLGADLTYPKEMEPGTFAWEFLKIYSSRVQNAKGGNTPGASPDDNLIGVKPFPGRPAVYPEMEQDPLKVSPFIHSIRDGDAIFDPIFAQDVDAFTGVLDSLYIYQAVRTNRTYNNKLNALRWHDPDPARTQGRVQWFGFPLYYMKKEQAQETFNRSIDWFREETRP